MHVLRAHMMEDSDYASLQERKVRLCEIDVHVSTDILAAGVVNGFMVRELVC